VAEDAPPVDQRHMPDPPDERGRSLRRAATITAGMGVVHAVLFLLAFVLLAGAPGPESTNVEIIAYYSSSAGSLPSLVGLYIMPFAVIAFMWFIVALRMWEAFSVQRENLLFSNLQLVSGILYVAMLSVGAAAQGVLAASTTFNSGPIDPELARQFPLYGSTVNIVFGVRMAAIFVFTTSNIGRTAGVLPRWFANLGFAVGVFMLLSVTLNEALVLVFPTWLVSLSAILIGKARSIPRDVMLPAAVGGSGILGRISPDRGDGDQDAHP
jgi:hypothetical protein